MIPSGSKRLRQLRLKKVVVEPDAWEALAAIPTLRNLDLIECNDIDDAALAGIARTKAKFVVFKDCTFKGGFPVNSLARLAGMDTVQFQSCLGLSELDMNILRHRMANCRVVFKD